MSQKLIFLNQDKVRRANEIFSLFSKTQQRSQGDQELKDRHLELLNEAKIKLTDKEDCIAFIYKMLGGATRTQEEEEKIKAKVSKSKKFSRVEKDDEDQSEVDTDD